MRSGKGWWFVAAVPLCPIVVLILLVSVVGAGSSRAVSATGGCGGHANDRSASSSRCLPGSLHVAAGPFVRSPIPYIGPYDANQLYARMRTIEAARGLSNVDPFFHTQPDGSWLDNCQKFVAILDGRSSSGYPTAAAGWAHFVAVGRAHPVGSADGMSPPPGAWLYYAPNHVVTYLGGNLVASTDVFGSGSAATGPANSVTDGPWHLRYRGWAAPY